MNNNTMSDLRELYQEVILDHSRNPRNCHELPTANHHAEGYNPLCGDRVTLYVKMDGNVLQELSFKGSGCAISTASISMLTEVLKGKTQKEAMETFTKFQDLVMGKENNSDLGKLAVFEGVKEFPARIKCAILAWHTLKAALENSQEPIKTE